MKRTKSAYMNYVCGNCFHKLYECTCEYFPPWSLIYIDEGIQDPVRVLNEKGYVTTGCCEGHFERGHCTDTNICLQMDYPEITERPMPEGFAYMKRKHAIFHEYPIAIMTKEECAEKKQDAVATLLAWCNELPKEKHFARGEEIRKESARRRAEDMERRLAEELERKRAKRNRRA